MRLTMVHPPTHHRPRLAHQHRPYSTVVVFPPALSLPHCHGDQTPLLTYELLQPFRSCSFLTQYSFLSPNSRLPIPSSARRASYIPPKNKKTKNSVRPTPVQLHPTWRIFFLNFQTIYTSCAKNFVPKFHYFSDNSHRAQTFRRLHRK